MAPFPAMQSDAHFNDVSGERGSGNEEPRRARDAAEHAIGMSSLSPFERVNLSPGGSKMHREQIVLMLGTNECRFGCNKRNLY